VAGADNFRAAAVEKNARQKIQRPPRVRTEIDEGANPSPALNDKPAESEPVWRQPKFARARVRQAMKIAGIDFDVTHLHPV
jgi:hypothetical protein